jgi:hypothetical protein
MSNPKNKKTHEQFISEIPKHLEITILGEYINTDTKIEYKCNHGTNAIQPWKILKLTHCCRNGYYESGKMWAKKTNDLDTLKERALKYRSNIDVSKTFIDTSGRYKKLANIKCLIHNQFYSSIAHNKIGLCPECNTERNIKQILAAGPKAWASQAIGSFVSKAETKWLDKLGIKGRQIWLEDVRYKVDGYDSETNTIYLYHGRFWHGCKETYDPDMIHPIVKIPMKDLYEKTMYYENKIKEAGYNLIVEWGP